MSISAESYERYLLGVEEQSKKVDPLGIAWNLGSYLEHWSPSSFSMMRRCPRQWQERYIHGRKERPAEAPFIGWAVHAGLERNFRQKISSHVDIPGVELLTWFTDEGWQQTLNFEQESRGEEVYWDTSPDQAKYRGALMLAEYHKLVSPRIQPIGSEGKVSVDFGLAVPVEGRYDVLREESCIDFKTGKKATKKPKEAWRIQAAVYTEATDKPVEFHSISAAGQTTVAIWTPLETEDLLLAPSQLERRRMVNGLRAISAEACMYMEVFGPDEPWPTHGRFHDWACGYCGYRADCPAWETGE